LAILIASVVTAVPSAAGAGVHDVGRAGTLDSAFGVGGIVRLSYLGDHVRGRGAAVAPGARIVVVGGAGDNENSVALVARLLPDGSLDRSFSTDGYATLKLLSASS
jgi:hypothetical protein